MSRCIDPESAHYASQEYLSGGDNLSAALTSSRVLSTVPGMPTIAELKSEKNLQLSQVIFL